MHLRSNAEKKNPSLCTQKQMHGSRQCANCAVIKSSQTMANLDLSRRGCCLFSVFLEAGDNAGSGQEEGLASLSLIFMHTLNVLNMSGIKILLFLYSGLLKKGR